jgi:hypothetical protein
MSLVIVDVVVGVQIVAAGVVVETGPCHWSRIDGLDFALCTPALKPSVMMSQDSYRREKIP